MKLGTTSRSQPGSSAVKEVAAMPAGGESLDPFASALSERAQFVRDDATIDRPAEPEPPPERSGVESHYGG